MNCEIKSAAVVNNIAKVQPEMGFKLAEKGPKEVGAKLAEKVSKEVGVKLAGKVLMPLIGLGFLYDYYNK